MDSSLIHKNKLKQYVQWHKHLSLMFRKMWHDPSEVTLCNPICNAMCDCLFLQELEWHNKKKPPAVGILTCRLSYCCWHIHIQLLILLLAYSHSASILLLAYSHSDYNTAHSGHDAILTTTKFSHHKVTVRSVTLAGCSHKNPFSLQSLYFVL
jgi:hypothetical protein